MLLVNGGNSSSMGRGSARLWGQSTRLIKAAVALSETSEGPSERAGDDCRPLEDGLEREGGVDVDFAAMEVLLNVGTAFGRG